MKRAELDRRIANGETLEDIVPVLMDDGADYYGYDYSMGTLENPTAIDGVEDLIDYVED